MTEALKDAPAFDFYPERWSQGTRHMTKVERCDYLDLLSFQWTEQGIPGDLDIVAKIIGYKKGAQISPLVLEKFPLCEDGKRRNARLEKIRADQRERIRKKSEQRKAAANARWEKTRSGTNAGYAQAQCGSDAAALREQCPPLTTHQPPFDSTPCVPLEGFGQGRGGAAKIPSTEQAKRVGAIMHRREATAWADKEVRAYRKLGPIPDEELTAVEAYYADQWPPDRDRNILRHDLVTLLNNWPGEVQRAQRHLDQEKPETFSTL